MASFTSFGGDFSTKNKSNITSSSMTGDTGGLIGGIASAAADIVGAGLSYDIGQKNLEAQAKQLKWSKYQQKMTWLREDAAVQRRVADLQRAGLSPVLAAGSAASSGPIVHSQAPQREQLQIPNTIERVLSIMQMKKTIDRTTAEIANIEQQRQKALMETGIKAMDLGIQQRTGAHSSPGAVGKVVRDLFNTVTSGHLGGTLMNYIEQLSKVKNEIKKDDRRQELKGGFNPLLQNLK